MASEMMSAYVRFFCKDEVSDDAKKIEKSVDRAADSMDEAGDAAGSRMTDGLEKGSGGMGKMAKAAAGAVAGIAALGAGILALAANSEEMTEDMGKLETAFTTAQTATGDLKWSTDDATATYDAFVGILGETDQAVEASNHLAELCTSQEELADWTNIASGIYAKFGDSLPLEGLTEAANETAKVGQITGPMADAINWATVTSDQWTQALGGNTDAMAAFEDATAQGMSAEDAYNAALATVNDETERAQMVTSTLSAIYGDIGAAYQSNNADLIAARTAQSDWNQAVAEAGAALQPVRTSILEAGAALMENLMPYFQQFAAWLDENMPAIQQTISDVATQVGEAIANAWIVVGPIVGMLKDLFLWFLTNLPLIAPILMPVLAGFLAFQAITSVVNGIRAAMVAWQAVTMAVSVAQNVLNAAMRANPIGIVIGLIATLIGFLVTAWNTNEGFRNAIETAWNAIKDTCGAVFGWIGDTINGIFQGIYDFVEPIVSGIGKFIEDIGNGLKSFFSFDWLKLPHFSFTGSINPLDWPTQGLPSIGVDWYAKGGIFEQPTLLPKAGGGIAGVGEAGAEAVAPISELMKYVTQAVQNAGGVGGGAFVSNVSVTTGETDPAKLARMIAATQRREAYAYGN